MTDTRLLPTGTVTFVFSDIEGSTRLIQQLGDSFRTVLERHHANIETAVKTAGGAVVGTEGDGVVLAFGSPLAALSCAAENWESAATMLGAAEATQVPSTPDHTDSMRILEDVQAHLGRDRAEAAHEKGTPSSSVIGKDTAS